MQASGESEFETVIPGNKGEASMSSFSVLETTIEDVHHAYRSGQLTARKVVQMYLERIEAYDKAGPAINAIITINPKALEEADRLDAALKSSGFVGPLHGIPVVVKDQADAQGMPTTLGSLLFKDYYPDRDAFVVEKLKKAGAIILAKTTLGELGGGDTHGSLFGSTRNPYALDRTVGGSSGGSAASVSANYATVGVGQEGLASIRRPSTWNCIVGMRPTAGLVSRGGVYAGWPEIAGSLGPMARTVRDLAILLDVMVGYDPADPLTARGVGHVPESYTTSLGKNGLKERASASCVNLWVSAPTPILKISEESQRFSIKPLRRLKPPAPRSSIRSLFQGSRSCSPSAPGVRAEVKNRSRHISAGALNRRSRLVRRQPARRISRESFDAHKTDGSGRQMQLNIMRRFKHKTSCSLACSRSWPITSLTPSC